VSLKVSINMTLSKINWHNHKLRRRGITDAFWAELTVWVLAKGQARKNSRSASEYYIAIMILVSYKQCHSRWFMLENTK